MFEDIKDWVNNAMARVRYGKIDHYVLAAAPHMRDMAMTMRKVMADQDSETPIRIIEADHISFDDGVKIDLSGDVVTFLEIRQRGLVHIGQYVKEG